MIRTTSRSGDATRARTWSVRVASVALVGLLLVSTACHSTAGPATPRGPVTLTLGYPDPRLYSTNDGFAVLVAMLDDEGLVTRTIDGRYEPGLAERWEQSPDGLTWRFWLRPGVTFHNGQPLDAATVATHLRRLMGPAARPGLRDALSIEADGPQQIVIRFRKPSRLLLDALYAHNLRSTGANPTGAGPFTLVNRTIDSATLDGFASYYRGKPAIDRIEIRPYKDARNAWSALLRGEIDFLYDLTPEAMDFIQGSSATQVKSFLSPFVYSLGFNQRHATLRNRDVRVALNEAINRDEIVKVPFGGRGVPATSPLFPKHWAYDLHLPAFHYAPADAGRRLDAAGLSVKHGDARHMPSRFRFTCLLPEGDPRFERIGLMLQRQLLEVGIDMQLEPLPTQTLVKRVASGDFDAFLYVMSSATLELVYTFWHSPEPGVKPVLDSGYRSADDAFDHVRNARNDDETRAAVTELQRVLYEDPPVASLCWAQTAQAVSGRFRLPSVIGRDLLKTVWQWKPAEDGSRVETTAAASPSPWQTP